MADKKTNLLVTLVFDENTDIREQVNTECAIITYIRNGLQHAIIGEEIKRFIIADDEIINKKLTEERKQGEWIYDKGSYKCPFCGLEITGKEDDLNYCCKCGAEMINTERGEE